MANSTAVQILDGNSSLKTVSTIDAMIAAAGSPSANYLSIQSTVSIPTAMSSGTVTLSSNPTVIPSSVWTITLSSNPTVIPSSAFTVTLSSNPTITSLTSGTVAISGGGVYTAAGSPSATLVQTVQFSTNTGAASVVAVSSGTINISTASVMFSSAGSPSAAYVSVQNASAAGLFLSSASPGIVSFGQATKANSLPFTLASDSTAFSVTPSSNINVSLIPVSAGGYSRSSVVLSTTTNGTLVSSVACQLYQIEGWNVSSLPAYVKIYNLSSIPTAGSSLVSIFYTLPCSSLGAGSISPYVQGTPFATGLSYTVTSSMSSSDTTVLQTANAVTLNLFYK